MRNQGLYQTVIGSPGAEGAIFGTTEERRDTYAVADDVTNEQFDAAIDEAKAEGNLSRANVVRKVRGETCPEVEGPRSCDSSPACVFTRTEQPRGDGGGGAD